MPRREYTWEEYYGMLVNCSVNWMLIPLTFLLGVVLPILRACFASWSPPDDWNPNNAWHIVGDLAMWQPKYQNFTDTNENSSTYGLWLPPPGTSY